MERRVLVVYRDDSSVLASVHQNGQKVRVSMRRPDGFNGAEATWLLSDAEVQRLTDAMDKEAIDLACSQGANSCME